MNDTCTISIDHYRDLVKAQMTLEILIELYRNKKTYLVDDVVKSYLKEGEPSECTD